MTTNEPQPLLGPHNIPSNPTDLSVENITNGAAYRVYQNRKKAIDDAISITRGGDYTSYDIVLFAHYLLTGEFMPGDDADTDADSDAAHYHGTTSDPYSIVDEVTFPSRGPLEERLRERLTGNSTASGLFQAMPIQDLATEDELRQAFTDRLPVTSEQLEAAKEWAKSRFGEDYVNPFAYYPRPYPFLNENHPAGDTTDEEVQNDTATDPE